MFFCDLFGINKVVDNMRRVGHARYNRGNKIICKQSNLRQSKPDYFTKILEDFKINWISEKDNIRTVVLYHIRYKSLHNFHSNFFLNSLP